MRYEIIINRALILGGIGGSICIWWWMLRHGHPWVALACALFTLIVNCWTWPKLRRRGLV